MKTSIKFYEQDFVAEKIETEILLGLTSKQKRISPKYFYDETGSQLFDEITRLPEYYVTRTEVSILKNNLKEITGLIDEKCMLIEYGAGSVDKIRLLLKAVRPKAYMPLDISRDHLLNSAERLASDFPWLEIHAACVDYSKPMDLPFDAGGVKRIAFFPGSSIGNSEPKDAKQFMANIAEAVGPNGGLLIGVDLKKSPQVLNAAYNDSQGLTAKFNLNVLRHINERLAGNFNLSNFVHRAFYNQDAGRIEMHLESVYDQIVSVMGERIHLHAGETIHTENSYKYAPEEFVVLAAQAGFSMTRFWTDPDEYFGVFYFETMR